MAQVRDIAAADAASLAVPLGGQDSGECRAAGRHETPLWVLKATQLLGAAAWACFARYINVYYSEIGMTRTQIGILGFVSPITSFVGTLLWGSLIDWLGEYKRTLITTQLLGTATIFLYMSAEVQGNFALVLIVTLVSNFMLSTGGPIVDAMCLTVLAEQNVTDEAYGDQRLWCAVGWGGMALIAGQLIDTLGLRFMFLGFAAIQSVQIFICVTFLPQPKPRQERDDTPEGEAEVAAAASSPGLCSFEVLWFFANLIQYGVSMSLIEGFLFVWLREDFQGTTNLLLGVATLVMCAFEVPVFKYIARLWRGEGSMTSVLFLCQVMLIARLLLYTLLPSNLPALVLLVEPLHGICFAAMWAATVEYGKRIAPPGAMARFQSLVNGLYYCVSNGLGSALWGWMAEPQHLGFNGSFYLDAAFLAVWAVVWHTGVFLSRRLRQSREAPLVSTCAMPPATAVAPSGKGASPA